MFSIILSKKSSWFIGLWCDVADLTPWVISEYLDLNVFSLPSKTCACPDNHCIHIAQKEMACRHFLFHIQCDYSSHDAKSVKCIFSFWKWSLTWLPSCCSKEGVPSESSSFLGKGRCALACRCCDCMRFSDSRGCRAAERWLQERFRSLSSWHLFLGIHTPVH